jgi:MoxR-like ATPase
MQPHSVETDALKRAFANFRLNRLHYFTVKLRRRRVQELRKILSRPGELDLDTFNREVWVVASSVILDAQPVRIDDVFWPSDEGRILALEDALSEGRLHFHGNSIWGSASRVYGPMLKGSDGQKLDDGSKLDNVRRALSYLNQESWSPLKKVDAIKEVPGFGDNVATGLVMVYHPSEFAICNNQSKVALNKLGATFSGVAEFEQLASALKSTLGAEDYLELDLFLYLIGNGKITLPPIESPDALDDLARELLLSAPFLRRVETLLKDRRQIIFYGPPGTGRTYVARKLAYQFAGAEGSVEMIQFHPSYAYEDFLEGFRPRVIDGQTGFSLVPGPLKRISEAARANPTATYVLLVDEINRGNLAKIFGELYFLLEYREQELLLQYSEDPFALPKNLWIIGTMNTADRSIALIDAALRRRFYFVPFFPDEPPVEGLLRRWLQRNKPELVWVADVVDRANGLLRDRQAAIGPSYFMRSDLNEEWLQLIWDYSIIPYLEERLLGEENRIAELKLEKLRQPEQQALTANKPIGNDGLSHIN